MSRVAMQKRHCLLIVSNHLSQSSKWGAARAPTQRQLLLTGPLVSDKPGAFISWACSTAAICWHFCIGCHHQLSVLHTCYCCCYCAAWQTSPCLNVFGAAANGKWHQPVLQHMIKRAKAEQLGEGAPFFSLTLLESYTHPRSSNKEHSSLLTPLLIQLVKGTNDRFAEEYGVRSAGNLVTTVIRATKAWSKGLVAVGQLQQPATSVHSGPGDGCSSNVDGSAETCLPAFRSTAAAVGAAPTAAAGTAKNAPAYPPGYVWEIFVLFVLERQLKQCRDESASAAVYSMHLGPLTLFMDVLLAASQLLRHTGWDQPEPGPIAVYYFFTEEECTLFRRNWGPVGPLYTPYIIHPADPRYNCVMHAGFARWGALADEAGLLHQQMQQLLYPQDEGVVGVGGNARVAGGSSGSGDVWQLIVDTTSLGAAVRAGNGT